MYSCYRLCKVVKSSFPKHRDYIVPSVLPFRDSTAQPRVRSCSPSWDVLLLIMVSPGKRIL